MLNRRIRNSRPPRGFQESRDASTHVDVLRQGPRQAADDRGVVALTDYRGDLLHRLLGDTRHATFLCGGIDVHDKRSRAGPNIRGLFSRSGDDTDCSVGISIASGSALGSPALARNEDTEDTAPS